MQWLWHETADILIAVVFYGEKKKNKPPTPQKNRTSEEKLSFPSANNIVTYLLITFHTYHTDDAKHSIWENANLYFSGSNILGNMLNSAQWALILELCLR